MTDDPTWINAGIVNLTRIAANSTHMYAVATVATVDTHIIQINLATKSIDTAWLPSLGSNNYKVSEYCACDETYLYFVDNFDVDNITLVKLRISDKTVSASAVLASATSYAGIFVDAAQLYLASSVNVPTFTSYITQYNLNLVDPQTFITIANNALTGNFTINAARDALYLSLDSNAKEIRKYTQALPDGAVFYTGLNTNYRYSQYVTAGAYLYATATTADNSNTPVVSKISLLNPNTDSTPVWKPIAGNFGTFGINNMSITAANDYIYASATDSDDNTIFNIGKFTLSGTPTPPPSITACAPAYGIATGGTIVTLTGTNLNTVTTLSIGTNPATIGTKTSTSLTATTGVFSTSGTTAVSITANATGFSGLFSYYLDAQAFADYLVAFINLPAGSAPPANLTTAMLGAYFSTLLTLGISAAEFLQYRETFTTTLFKRLADTYPLAAPVANITIDASAFPYTQAELTATTPSTIATTPKNLINYAVNNYYVSPDSFTFENEFANITKALNEGSYVNMPNVNGNIFTYVFNNIKLTAIAKACTFVGGDISNDATFDIYVQIDVQVIAPAPPTYRIKTFTAIYTGQYLEIQSNNDYYIILALGNVNWAAIDNTATPGKVYQKYTVIQYNGQPITTTPSGQSPSYTAHLTTLQQITPRTPAQTLMQFSQTLTVTLNNNDSTVSKSSTLNLKYNFMMGSINALGGSATETALPNSNICFPAGTPIKTDQGLVPIERVHIQTHTIGGQAIKHVTQTVTLDKYLIRFEKDALARNYPNQTTVMTKDHQILFRDQLVPAARFLTVSDKVQKVTYTGESLYNILLAEHSLMQVNNLTCETLHPDNIIAKLYTSNNSETYKQNLILVMNNTLARRDEAAYKKIVSRLQL